MARAPDAIIQGEDLATYVIDRKLHQDKDIQKEQKEKLQKVKVHNSFFKNKIQEELDRYDEAYVKYYPKKSTEAHFWVPSKGLIHVVNPRGIIRLKRDEELVTALAEPGLLNRKIAYEEEHYKNDPVKAASNFNKFGNLLGDDVLENIKSQKLDISKKINLMFGPHRSINFNNLDIVADNIDSELNEFLNYKIFLVDDNVTVSFDYIFADQAKNLLSKLYRMLGQNGPIDINVFHYGKIGGVNPDLKISGVGVPNAGMEELSILKGRKVIYPIENMLAEQNRHSEIFNHHINEYHIGTTVNTVSVLSQTRSNLEKVLNANGDFLEMEWVPMAGPMMGASTAYGPVNISQFYAGVISDKPLQGQNMGNTRYNRNMLGLIAEAYIEIIRNIR